MADLKIAGGEKFSFTVANTYSTDKVIALCPAYFDTLKSIFTASGTADTPSFTNPAAIVSAGWACDAVLDDGIVAGSSTTTITCTASNSKMTIRSFLSYLKHFSRPVRAIRVVSTSTASYDQTMEVVTVSPLTGSRPQYIPLNMLRDKYSNISTLLEIDSEGLTLGFNTLILLPLVAGASVNITFLF